MKNLLTIIKQNILEYYTLVLLSIGLPLVAYVYFGWKAALTVFILVQATLGLFALVRAK